MCILYILNIYNIYKGEKAVDIIISNSSGKPIYDQIYTEIKSKIISGELKEGDPLPSMRLLAKELRISVITTKRAYEELERDGFITSITGKGSFVSGKNTEFIREDNLRKIEEHMQSIIELSKGCNLSLQDLIEMISIIYEED